MKTAVQSVAPALARAALFKAGTAPGWCAGRWRFSSCATSPASAATSSVSAAGSAPATAAAADHSLHVTVEPLAAPHEGTSVVTLSRPKARNAIGRQLLRELREAINNLRQERSTRCVLVRSAVPGIFCAGADLKERASMTQAETTEFVSLMRRTMHELQEMPMPTICVVEGAALGGGAEMALATDLRVMGADATVAFPETRLGIIPGAGGTQRLPRLVGTSKAKELIFTGRTVGAHDALHLGLADYVVDAGKAYEHALALAADISRGAPLALRMAKAALAQSADVDLSTGMHIEAAYYAQLIHTRDRLEGLQAFSEKRPPRYTGE